MGAGEPPCTVSIALFSPAALATFALVGLAAGLRALGLARRTRRLPEAAVGLALLLYGPFGYVPVVLGRQLGNGSGAVASATVLMGVVAQTLGAACLYLFIWRLFAAHRRTGLAWLLLALALLCTGAVADVTFRLWAALDGGGWSYLGSVGARTGALLWASVESLRWHARMRRRQRLGLAHPVEAQRFLLWAVASGAGGAAMLLWVAVLEWTGVSPATQPAANAAISVLALGAAGALWLTFFPPRSVRDHLQRPAEAGREAGRGAGRPAPGP